MRQMRRIGNKFGRLISVVCVCFFVCVISVEAADVPGMDAEVNAENALAILQAYDPDGYYIVNWNMQNKSSSFGYWLTGNNSNAQALDTAVHEEFHGYSFRKGGFREEAIYIGDQQDIMVDESSNVTIFPSSEMAEQIPADLRTFRYDTYVSSSSNASANLSGPYGLLNEFTAYSWGMNNQIQLFDYYKLQGNTFDVWTPFFINCANDRMAFTEFRYWILRYLEYARTNHPEVYEHFLGNQSFIEAYCTTEQRFEALISEFDVKCDEIIAMGQQDGHNVKVEGSWLYFDNRGTGAGEDYEKLLTEIQKPEYQSIEKALFDKAGYETVSIDPISISLNESSLTLEYGDSVQLTATVSPDDATDKTVSWNSSNEAVAVVDASGRVTAVAGGTAVISAVTNTGGLTAVCAVNVEQGIFRDVKKRDWWIGAVQYVYENGIMAGTGEYFYPADPLTREQFTQVLYNHKGKPTVNVTNPFPDVKNDWYRNSVLWAKENDIANGNGDGTFGVGNNITREALALMLYKYAVLNDYNLTTYNAAINGFSDMKKVSPWAKNAMNWAVTQGIISGKGEGEDISAYRLDPQGNATRAECASMMRKMLTMNQ